jgi:hypothetical protein
VTDGRAGRAMELTVECTCEAHPNLRCSASSAAEFPERLRCAVCGAERSLERTRLSSEGGLNGCLVCAHPELYTRKDFPRAVGLAIVVVAAVLAPWTHYASLVAAAVLDFALYRLTKSVMVCYVCGAEHRGFAPMPRHPRFDREIAERLRFGPRAVMGKAMRATGTADAPEPEH